MSFFAPPRDWKWRNKAQTNRVGGVGVVSDATPFFVIFINLQISAVENFGLIFPRNRRMAKYFLNTAKIAFQKTDKRVPFENHVI